MSSDRGSLALPHLHVVGDSISLRYGPNLERMLRGVARYSRKPPVGDDPESANGRDSGAVLAYLVGVSAAERADIDYLMVNCGLHDIKRNLEDGHPFTPLDQYVDNLRTIMWYAREGTHTLVWVRTSPVIDAIHNSYEDIPFRRFASDVATYNEAADAVMMEADAFVIDLFGFTQSLGPDVYADHVHFKPEIARLQAAFIAGNLAQIIT
jgi:lysophospholipase L1-like esterase